MFFFANHSHEVDIGSGGRAKLLVVVLIFCSFQVFFCRFCWNYCPPHLRGLKCKWKCLPSPLSKSWGCSSQSQSENPKVLLMNWLISGLPCLQLGTSKSTYTIQNQKTTGHQRLFCPFCQKSQVYYLQQRSLGDLGARGSGRTNNYRHLVLSI